MTAIRDLETHAEPFVTPAELAAYWRLSVRTIYFYIAKGALPAKHYGARIRVRTDDARAFGRPAAVEFGPVSSIDLENRSTPGDR